MKKLNKLEINSDKIMKNEELFTLKGGYYGSGCGVACKKDSDCTDPLCPDCADIGGWGDFCENP